MLKGLGGLGDMAKMMAAAKDMQAKMADMQENLGKITVTEQSSYVAVARDLWAKAA